MAATAQIDDESMTVKDISSRQDVLGEQGRRGVYILGKSKYASQRGDDT